MNPMKNFHSEVWNGLVEMRILQFIQGFPPQFNADSDNYTKTICNELLDKMHKVPVI